MSHQPNYSDNYNDDERPPVWIGHAGPLVVPDLKDGVDFYEALGLRRIHGNDELAALQLRGGTHLVLLASAEPSDGCEAPFDLMVDDLEALHAQAGQACLAPSPIERSGAHHRFVVVDPGGNRVRVHDSHVVGPA